MQYEYRCVFSIRGSVECRAEFICAAGVFEALDSMDAIRGEHEGFASLEFIGRAPEKRCGVTPVKKYSEQSREEWLADYAKG